MKFISIFHFCQAIFTICWAILKNVKLYPQQLKVNQTIPCLFVSIKFLMGMGGGIKNRDFLMSGTGVTLAAVVAEGVGFWRQRNMKTFTLPPPSFSLSLHTHRQQHTLLQQQRHMWMDNRELCLIFQLFSYSAVFFFYFPPRFLPLRQLADNLFKAPDDSVNFLINIKYETLPQPKKSNPDFSRPISSRNQNWGQMPALRARLTKVKSTKAC